ncbi:hypothetical protein CR513_07358, partial [Mucuna pruriens]
MTFLALQVSSKSDVAIELDKAVMSVPRLGRSDWATMLGPLCSFRSSQGSRPIKEGLSQDKVILVRPTPSQPGRVTWPSSSIKEQPNKEWSGCTFHVNHPTQRPPQLQLNYHVTLGIACNARRARGRLGNPHLLETGKPKSVRGDCLGFQHTLMDLILSAQATRGELPPSTMAISQSNFVASILHLAKTKSDKSLPRPYRLSFCREQLGQLPRRTTKDEFIKLAPLSGTQVLLCLCVPKPGRMENTDRTLKELATPDVVYQPWCIQYPQLEPTQTYELKFGLIHLLSKFHGLAREDPHKHLKEFHVGIPEDYIKMKAFSFSLDGAAKDWLYLQPALFNTWGDMKHTFLEKFFLASRIASIRKEICGIRQ